MLLIKKMYLRIRFFLFSIRKILDKVAIFTMVAILFYIVINDFLFKNIILATAYDNQIMQNNKTAITLYNVAYSYYSLNHFSQENKQIYFELPYRISICYLNEKDKKDSVESMLKALTSIQQQSGIFSADTAYFMRKYLIEYYLTNNNFYLAQREFNNLLIIYKHIGYNDNEMVDLIRLAGDLYYQQKKYDQAINLYQQAYESLSVQKNIDYEVFTKIVDRICAYEIQEGNTQEAINIYKSSINLLDNTNTKQPELEADMLIDLGNLYVSKDNQNIDVKSAIECYEKAIAIIKKLPRANYLRKNLDIYLTKLKDMYTQNNQFHDAQQIDSELLRRKRFSFLK